ncbi:MAG: ATP-binding cassette domain-containing protein [Ignavibacteria bacterium]
MIESKEIIRVTKLKVSLIRTGKVILDNINFSCNQSEILTILGKNGEGKTTLALSLTKLLDRRVYLIKGEVFVRNKNIFEFDENNLQQLRRDKIGYILQNPFAAFNPVYKIKDQFEELCKLKNLSFENVIYLMKQLNLEHFDQILNKYPFELSGGMLQRLSAIRVIAYKPEIIIADEPTSALDRPISNQLINLLRDYVKGENGVLIFITQDISIAESISDKIAFLSNGKLSDPAEIDKIFEHSNNIELNLFLNSYLQLKI